MAAGSRPRASHTVTPLEGGVRVSISGEVDLASADLVQQWLTSAVDDCTADGAVEVDLSGLDFIDSTGIRALVMARRHAMSAGVGLYLEGARGMVERILRVAGVLDVFARP
ncbi:STAS domain-containing protein [Catellatospora sp. KI3]|uniref:STAS domain-containing protein n=1 Tax=Catellatospora sp. KI3 TaxID=3041620 RepID=UPI0024825CE9|nr:STAS domain-containing protein [Catellatospora sp. KI3]MDI1464693.1 STAS domain-containing protein [Catellatospora sp. KI3]